MNSVDLINQLTGKYTIEKRVKTTVINYNSFSFFISVDNNRVFQISVGNKFDGKFLGKIGIGSTLADIEKYVGKWEEELDMYILPDYKGVSFELKDIENFDEDWIEHKMPIEWINIYETNND